LGNARRAAQNCLDIISVACPRPPASFQP
jgi:hypothetical protein